MQKVNTFDAAYDAHSTADDRTAHVTGLGRAIREVWARLPKSPTGDRAVEATPEADESLVADDGSDTFANYYSWRGVIAAVCRGLK